jgi:hypothetical protein
MRTPWYNIAFIPAVRRTRPAEGPAARHALVTTEALERRVLMAAGIEWTRTSLDLFGNSIGAAVAPDGTYFVSDGFGIDRSVDHGAHWSPVTTGATFAGGAIAVDPHDPNVMIAGRGHGLLKSVDAGAHWFELPDLNAGAPATSIVFDPDDS